MRSATLLLPLFLILVTAGASAQSFTISTSPRIAVMKDGKAEYEITATPRDGFDASVYLTVTTELPDATVRLDPPTLNVPYSKPALLTITPVGAKVAGLYRVFIEARNGPIVLRDTVMMEIRELPGWRVYNTRNSQLPKIAVMKITVDRTGAGWLTTMDATKAQTLVRFDGDTWTEFTVANQGLPGTMLGHPVADSTGGAWFHIDSGLAHWRSGVWTIYTPANSSIPHHSVGPMAVAPNGDLWALIDTALVKFDGTSWVSYGTVFGPYSTSNTPHTMAIAPNGHVWVGSSEYLHRFDGMFLTTYRSADLQGKGSGYPIYEIDFAPDNTAWVTLQSGVVKIAPGAAPVNYDSPGSNYAAMAVDYRGGVWFARRHPWDPALVKGSTQFTVANSGLPSNEIYSVKVAPNGTLWIGTIAGLALYNPRFPASIDDHTPSASSMGVRIKPHPVVDQSSVSFTLAAQSHARVSIANSLGEEVAVLLDEPLEAGAQRTRLDATSLPAGAYFLRIATASGVETRPFVVAR